MLVVTVAEPEPLMLVLLSMTAGPVGEAVMVRSTILSKPYFGTTVIVAVPGLSAVIVGEMKLTGEVAEMIKSGGGPCTMSAKAVGVVVLSEGLPVTCTTYEPIGVKGVEERVRMLEPEGVNESGLNMQEAPAGKLDLTQDSVTGSELPLFNVAVIVLVPPPPCRTMIPPELDRE